MKVKISQLFLSYRLLSSQQVCTGLSVKLPVATKDAYFNVVVIRGDFKFLLNNTVPDFNINAINKQHKIQLF